jgi:hypothetical protein
MSDDQLTVIQNIPANNGTVLAYTVGQTISREVVEANDWQDYVAGPATKAAKEAVAPSTTKKES